MCDKISTLYNENVKLFHSIPFEQLQNMPCVVKIYKNSLTMVNELISEIEKERRRSAILTNRLLEAKKKTNKQKHQ